MNVVIKVTGDEDGFINRVMSVLSENDVNVVEIYDEAARSTAPAPGRDYGNSVASAISAAVRNEH